MTPPACERVEFELGDHRRAGRARAKARRSLPTALPPTAAGRPAVGARPRSTSCSPSTTADPAQAHAAALEPAQALDLAGRQRKLHRRAAARPAARARWRLRSARGPSAVRAATPAPPRRPCVRWSAGDLPQRIEHGEAPLVEVALAHAGRPRAVGERPVAPVLARQEAPGQAEIRDAGEPVPLAYRCQLALVFARAPSGCSAAAGRRSGPSPRARRAAAPRCRRAAL